MWHKHKKKIKIETNPIQFECEPCDFETGTISYICPPTNWIVMHIILLLSAEDPYSFRVRNKFKVNTKRHWLTYEVGVLLCATVCISPTLLHDPATIHFVFHLEDVCFICLRLQNTSHGPCLFFFDRNEWKTCRFELTYVRAKAKHVNSCILSQMYT